MSRRAIKPYNTPNKTKKQEVTAMFNAIAATYDALNHSLSMGIDHWWRKQTIQQVALFSPKKILDIATGTGDLAIAASRLPNANVKGIDIAENMVLHGERKIAKKHLANRIKLEVGDVEQLRFRNNSFDVVMVGFGVRNFGNLNCGLREMYRVTKPGGGVVILEFSQIRVVPLKQLFSLYSRFVIPTIGKVVSKDRRAYRYLPDSVAAFPAGAAFETELCAVGYKHVQQKRLAFGVATIYRANK